MRVLLVTRSDDNDSVNLVSRALQSRGADPFRLDSDLYPQQLRLSTFYRTGGARSFISSGSRRLDLASVDALYYRRFAAGNLLPQELGDTRPACREEARLALYGTIAAMDCFQLDPLGSIRRADYKELQTVQAMRLGLDCPSTLFTNDPEAVLEFLSRAAGPVVTKMQSQFAIYRDGMENVVFTNEVRADDLKSLDGLRYAPMMFQEMVPKRLELRVTLVGRHCFAASIDSQRSERARVDWRRDGIGLIDAWRPYELPGEVEAKLLDLATYFGLNYAAADFIVTPDDRHVFLEINACGEWFWLERAGLPIADAIAEVLVEPAARRVP